MATVGAGAGERANRRRRLGGDKVPFVSVAGGYLPGLDPAVHRLRPSFYWQHPTYVMACLGQDVEDPAAFETRMKKAQRELPGGTQSWIGTTDVYRDKAGQWTRHQDAQGKLSPKRPLFWCYVTLLVDRERLYEVAPVSAEAQIEFAEALLGNATLYAAVLNGRVDDSPAARGDAWLAARAAWPMQPPSPFHPIWSAAAPPDRVRGGRDNPDIRDQGCGP